MPDFVNSVDYFGSRSCNRIFQEPKVFRLLICANWALGWACLGFFLRKTMYHFSLFNKTKMFLPTKKNQNLKINMFVFSIFFFLKKISHKYRF